MLLWSFGEFGSPKARDEDGAWELGCVLFVQGLKDERVALEPG